MTNGIQHLLSKDIKIETTPEMKVDIDGEIALKTPIHIEVIPKAIQILTLPENTPDNEYE